MSHETDEGIVINDYHSDPKTPMGGEEPAVQETSAPEAEAQTTEVPATSEAVPSEEPTPTAEEEPSDDILALQTAVDAAKTPEDKAKAQSKLNYAWSKIKEEKQALKERLAYFQGQAEERARAQQPAPSIEQPTAPLIPEPPMPPKPRPEDYLDADGYQDQEAFVEATMDWKVDCRLIRQDYENQLQVAKEQQNKAIEAQQIWEAKGEEQFPGFKAKVDTVLRPLLHQAPRDIAVPLSISISESEKSHELTMYLVNNPKEMQRLLSLSPASALREVGKLETRLEKPSPKTTTTAPTPITPVTGASVAEVNPANLSDEEYFAQAKQKIAKTRRYF